MSFTTNQLILNLATGGTTGIVDVSQRSAMSLQCMYTESAAGTVQFTVTTSNNDDDFVNYQRLVTNIVSGILGDQVVTSTLTLSSVTVTGILFFPDNPCLKSIKVVAKKISPRVAETAGKVKVWLQSRE